MERKKSFSVRRMVLCAALAAIEVVLSRFAGLQINEGLRISFEAVPLILAGIWLGPLWGMAAAVIADLTGTILSGYGVYFPLLTVGPVLITVVTGMCGTFVKRAGRTAKGTLLFILAAVLAEAVSTFSYTPWALTLYYSVVIGKEMPFAALFLTRLPTKLVTLPVDILLSLVLHRSLYDTVIARMVADGRPREKEKEE